MIDPWGALKARIAAGKVSPDKVHPDYAFQRAWNEALVWVEKQMETIEGSKK